MDLDLPTARSSLTRAPALLRALFNDIDDAWLAGDEGPGTWSSLETLTHLVHVEPSWMARMDHIAAHGAGTPFPLVDRSDHMDAIGARPASWLLDRFDRLRSDSLARLDVTAFDAARPGHHRELGPVTMGQLLAAWTVHDLNHTGQMVKAMAKQCREAVGPWRRFLAIVDAP